MCLIFPITNLNNIYTIVLYTIFCMLLLLKNQQANYLMQENRFKQIKSEKYKVLPKKNKETTKKKESHWRVIP